MDSLCLSLTGISNDSVKFDRYLDLGIAWQDENPDSALYYHLKAKELAEKMKSNLLKGEAMRHLGWDYFAAGEYNQAIKILEEIFPIVDNLLEVKAVEYKRVKRLQAVAMGSLGNIFLSKGDYNKALDYYLKSMRINEEISNFDHLSVNLSNIGLIYSDLGDYGKALDYYRRAIKITRQTGNRAQEANCLTNMGLVYREQENYPLALEYYFNSLAIDIELNNKRGLGDEYGNIGLVYSDLGNLMQERCACNNDSGN